jgi:excisionase family DNA binding protein
MTVNAVVRHEIPPQDREPARDLGLTFLDVGGEEQLQVVIVAAGRTRKQVVVPRSMFEAFARVASRLGEKGQATLVEEEQEITPEEAAGLLGMSRPIVMHRIKHGDIPHRMVGTHHRLRLADVLAFRDREQAQRDALDEIGAHTDAMTRRYGA